MPINKTYNDSVNLAEPVPQNFAVCQNALTNAGFTKLSFDEGTGNYCHSFPKGTIGS